MSWIYSLVVALGLSWSAMDHDLHLSKTEIRFNQETQSLEIVMHVFIDDLEIGIGDTKGKLGLGTDREVIHADSIVSEYLLDNFSMLSNDNHLPVSYLGKEVSDDLMAFWVYMEVVEPPLADDILVRMTLFDDLYDDQKNIVDLKYDDGHREFALLRRGDTELKMSIK